MTRTRTTALSAASALGVAVLAACGSGHGSTSAGLQLTADGPCVDLWPPAPQGEKAVASTDSGTDPGYGY
jgi:hypothetical protein